MNSGVIKVFAPKDSNRESTYFDKQIKVRFAVSDNGFSQIFYNCSNVEEIFSWHN